MLEQWDAIKRKEKGDEKEPYLHGVGKGLPGIIKAAKLQKKAAKVGFDWPDQAGVIAKLKEELSALEQALESGNDQHVEDELGDLLFSAVNLARFRKLDPEVVMTQANNKFEARFAKMEASLDEQGLSLEDASLEQMEAAWQAAK